MAAGQRRPPEVPSGPVAEVGPSSTTVATSLALLADTDSELDGETGLELYCA
jgi:hypothetical protein